MKKDFALLFSIHYYFLFHLVIFISNLLHLNWYLCTILKLTCLFLLLESNKFLAPFNMHCLSLMMVIVLSEFIVCRDLPVIMYIVDIF